MSSEFKYIGDVVTDARFRASLGRAGAKPGQRYRVETNPSGVLILFPVNEEPYIEAPIEDDEDAQ